MKVVMNRHHDRYAETPQGDQYGGREQRIEIVDMCDVGPKAREIMRHISVGEGVEDTGYKRAHAAAEGLIEATAGTHQQPRLSTAVLNKLGDQPDDGFLTAKQTPVLVVDL
jgi:hypothetical protein